MWELWIKQICIQLFPNIMKLYRNKLSVNGVLRSTLCVSSLEHNVDLKYYLHQLHNVYWKHHLHQLLNIYFK